MEERFVIFRNGSIGNTLVAVPAIRALRRVRPEALIAVVVDTIGRELLRYCPYVDELYVYEKRGQHRSLGANAKFVRMLRRKRFTTAILLKRFFRNGFLSFLAGIPVRIGYETDGKAPFLTRTIPYVEGRNIIALNLDLVKLLGADSADLSLEVWVSEREQRTVERFFRDSAIGDDALKVVLHLGGISKRGWAVERYAALADRFRAMLSARPIFLCPPSDREAVERAVRLMTEPAVVDPAHFTVLDRAELIRRCDLFVGNDSGPSHMADAAETPGVIFCHSESNLELYLSKWKPLGERYRVLTTDHSVDDCLKACEHLLRTTLSVTREARSRLE